MIGVGGFSRVFLGLLFILARHLNTQKFYALKVVEKKFILQNNKQEIVMNESDIMKKIRHPFISKLEFAFQSVYY